MCERKNGVLLQHCGGGLRCTFQHCNLVFRFRFPRKTGLYFLRDSAIFRYVVARAKRVLSSEEGHFSKHARPGQQQTVAFASFEEVFFKKTQIPFWAQFLPLILSIFFRKRGSMRKVRYPLSKWFVFLLNLQNFPCLRNSGRIPACRLLGKVLKGAGGKFARAPRTRRHQPHLRVRSTRLS